MDTSSSSSASSSSTVQIMNNGSNGAADTIEYHTTNSITLCLKYKKDQYTIIDKHSNVSCWSTFGLPAKILGPDKYEVLNNLHLKLPAEKSIASSPTRNTPKPVNTKNLEKHKHQLTSLLSEWLCSGTRPVNMVEDIGLKAFVDHCIHIGYMYGPIPGSSLLPCRRTVNKEIKHMASAGRNQMKTTLIKAAKRRCLTLSTDIWSDGYKKVSYLGCTAQWVDENWNLCSFELFCLPFRKPNKTSKNVFLVIEEGLALYDLQPFMDDIIWVCDRGSNLKKALDKFTVVHCIGHRLNNILQKTFYQAETSKAKKDIAFGDLYVTIAEDEDDEISGCESEEASSDSDIDEKLLDKRTKNINYASSISNKNNATTTIAQLPSDAKRLLITIIHSKELVQYVKKVNLNQDLEEKNTAILIQSTIVRWLSLYNCLKSVRGSLTALTEIFDEKHLEKKRINLISIFMLDKLIEFLKPWTYVMKRVQSSLVPSVHTVTPIIFMVNSSLDIKANDSKQEKGIMFFRQRAKQIMKQMIIFDPIHLIETFFNPKTRKMTFLTAKQREECLEYVKQEMLIFDVDQQVPSPSHRKEIQLRRNTSSSYMADFYLIAEREDVGGHGSSKISAHEMEIDMYLKHGVDRTTNGNTDQGTDEYNPLCFWKARHSSYPVLYKVAARVLAVPATSSAVEREFSFTGNIITQKRSRLCPNTVNDIVCNHSYALFKMRFGESIECETIEL
ncbi:unnamed protein product [Adineta ricciae]|uniref:HAT C-terminal dimerisation domain-containing protein n=1 Tax=Adineta ricciae TaxID=249248 RepID=A0A814PT77_ADIRI|nr:unnamed protein product [Adineta ricciae]CAF1514598.1 unnamed protein product [Adineta ricciae]